MRLINADNITWTGGRGNGKSLFADMFKKIIEAAPTVEAIPIDWIKKHGEENYFDYGTQYNAITCMLEAWAERKDD